MRTRAAGVAVIVVIVMLARTDRAFAGQATCLGVPVTSLSPGEHVEGAVTSATPVFFGGQDVPAAAFCFEVAAHGPVEVTLIPQGAPLFGAFFTPPSFDAGDQCFGFVQSELFPPGGDTRMINFEPGRTYCVVHRETPGSNVSFELTIGMEVTGPPERAVPVPTASQEVVFRGCPSLATCSAPCRVYLHSGEEHFERTDLVIPGRGEIHFVMSRSYRSRLDYDGPLGYGWDFSYNESLFPQPNGDVVRNTGKGHVDTWTRRPDGSFKPPPGFFRTLVQKPDGTFVTRSPEGFRRVYGSDGRLQAHIDRHGNTMSFEYDARGNLDRVIDAYGRAIDFRFETSPDGVDRLVAIEDFSGREVFYSYDEHGDLISVRTPVVTGTSTGNDFPQGKTERYAYSSGLVEPELNHNLISVTRPEEAAGVGPPAITWTYGESSSDPLTFDRVVAMSQGGGRTNASGIPAGGEYRFEYEVLNREVPPGDPDVVRGKARITERNGNVVEYFTNELNQHILTRRFTRGLREGEPEFYETRSRFDEDGQLISRISPAGNEIRYTYASGPRGAQQNVIEVRRIADPERGGGEDLVKTFTYEPLYRQVASATDPRGNASDFEPPLGQASSARYTTRFFYDYQEGSQEIPEATEFGIDLSAVQRGLGDLNGDGRTDQTAGNAVRVAAPSVTLLAESREAARLGGTTQEIITDTRWNDRGQAIAVIDPEGNVTAFEYFAGDDPDGDGTPVETPRSNDPSGYVSSVIVDAADSPRRLSDAEPAQLRTRYQYDAVGNLVAMTNPRGVVTRMEVNQLNQPVAITRGADVAEAAASGQLITGETAFAYRMLRFYDHNDRVIRMETENRQDVSTTDGVGSSVERTFTHDLLDNPVRWSVEVDDQNILVWERRYDAHELPTLFTEPEGNRRAITWDERNLPFRITRGLGSAEESTVRIDYDLNSHRSRLTDAEDNDGDGENESSLLEYDGFDRLTSTTDPLGNQSIIDYDPASNVVRQRVLGHPPGQPGAPNVLLSDVRTHRDELHRAYRIDRALFLSEGFDPARAIELQDQNSDGLVTERVEYDRSSRRTREIEDDLQETRWIYDGANRPIEKIDHLGNREFTEYDRNSNPVKVTSIELSPEALVSEETFTTLYVYDQLDRLVRATDSLGQTTRLRYDSRDNLTFRSDPEGALTSDPLGLFPDRINEPGNTRTWFYDGFDRRVRDVSDLRMGGRGGNPLDLDDPENPDGKITLSYSYDGNSRLTGIIDDNGNRTSFAYDALNRQVSQTNADEEQYVYVRDRDDNIRGVIDPNGSMIVSEFDALNRLTERRIERAPGVVGTTRETFEYDGLSRLTRRTDDNGSSADVYAVETVYDSLSRRWEERQIVPPVEPSMLDAFTRGDANGDGRFDVSDAVRGLLWLTMGGEELSCLDAADSNDDGSVDVADASYSLATLFVGGPAPASPYPDCGADLSGDDLGCARHPPCEEGPAARDAQIGAVSTVWSGDGNRLSCTYPGGRTITSTYDAIDRVKTTSDGAGSIAECFWIGPGLRELRRLYGNGTSLSYLDDPGTGDVGYDGVQRIVRLRWFLPDDVTAFVDREYGYNRAGMRSFERRRENLDLTDSYIYDSVYRIAETRLDEGGPAGATARDILRIGYALDGAGNRRRLDQTFRGGGTSSETFTVNEMNEYTAAMGVVREHSDNGNLTADDTRTFSYDYKNRLARVSRKADGAQVAAYHYYADNRRSRKITFGGGAPGTVESDTVFFYDGARVCEERDASGRTAATYVWSPIFVDELLQMERDGRAYYMHQNARADIVAVTDAAGNVVERRCYDDFGRAFDEAKLPADSSSIGNPYGFQGRQLDPETGLYYFRHRYYDPTSGRFVQRDALWDERNVGGWYTFVGNSPASRFDPMGLAEWSDTQWQDFLERKKREIDAAGERPDINRLWQLAVQKYFELDPEDDLVWDCTDDVENLLEAFFENYSWGDYEYQGRMTQGHFSGWERVFQFDTDGSILSHFFGGTQWGSTAQDVWEASAGVRLNRNFSPSAVSPGTDPDTLTDTAAAYLGDKFEDWFTSLNETYARRYLQKFSCGSLRFTDLLGPVSEWRKVSSGQLAPETFADQQMDRIKEMLRYEPPPRATGNVCFVAGTPVRTEKGLVPIEDVEPGDCVLGYDESTESTGPYRVKGLIRGERRDLLRIEIESQPAPVVCSSSHRFWVEDGGWIEAADLAEGDRLVDHAGRTVRVAAVHDAGTETPVRVYNFEIDGAHTYFVGESGVRVHNMKLR